MVELDKILKDSNDIDLKSVIEVRVSEDVARERILGRVAEAKEGEARSDDNEEVFKKRMKIYTDPLPDIQSSMKIKYFTFHWLIYWGKEGKLPLELEGLVKEGELLGREKVLLKGSLRNY